MAPLKSSVFLLGPSTKIDLIDAVAIPTILFGATCKTGAQMVSGGSTGELHLSSFGKGVGRLIFD